MKKSRMKKITPVVVYPFMRPLRSHSIYYYRIYKKIVNKKYGQCMICVLQTIKFVPIHADKTISSECLCFKRVLKLSMRYY